MVSETFWAYLAGFFDGEGHLVAGRGTSFNLVQVGERGRILLEWIRAQLIESGIPTNRNGNKVLVRKAPSKHMVQMPWRLEITSRPGVEFVLPRILPYLRIKKVIAQDTLRYLRLYPSQEGFRRFRTRCPKGHLYTEQNTKWGHSSAGNPYRKCRICAREFVRVANRRHRERTGHSR